MTDDKNQVMNRLKSLQARYESYEMKRPVSDMTIQEALDRLEAIEERWREIRKWSK